jgi:hypothetical protein
MRRNEYAGKIGALLTTILALALWVNAGWSQTGTTVIKIIPQIASGSFDNGATRYSTVIEIINPDVTSINVSGSFFTETGTPSTLPFATTSTTTPTFSNGTFDTFQLDPGKIIVISTGTTTATTPITGTIAWGRISSNGPVTINTYFELRDARTGQLLSRVGVAPSPTNMTKFVIPRVRNVANGFDVGFALVNTGTIASLTATLRDANGATIAVKNFTMPAGSHLSQFAVEFFGLTNEPAGTTFSFIVFDSSNAPQFAAIALSFEGAQQTSFPVDVLR